MDVATGWTIVGVLLLALAMLVVSLALLVRSVWKSVRFWRAMIGVTTGRYAEALPLWRAASDAWWPSSRFTALHNTALCLHHLARFEEAEALLRELGGASRNAFLAGLGDGLLGTTLALTKKHPAEAERLILSGHRVFPARSTFAYLAHLALDRGDHAEAARLMEKANTDPPGRATRIGWISARAPRGSVIAVEGYLHGLYHRRIGQADAAREAFARAAEVASDSFYVTQARAELSVLDGEGKTWPTPTDEEAGELGPFTR